MIFCEISALLFGFMKNMSFMENYVFRRFYEQLMIFYGERQITTRNITIVTTQKPAPVTARRQSRSVPKT